MNIRLRLTHGPGPHAPFAAVLAEFASDWSEPVPSARINGLWQMLNGEQSRVLSLPSPAVAFPELVKALVMELQHPDDPESAQLRLHVQDDARSCTLALAYTDASGSAQALRFALTLADALFSQVSGRAVDVEKLAVHLRQVRMSLRQCLPQMPIVRTLVREARRRSIPVYPIAEGSGIWQFGQGVASFHYCEAANQQDSFTGMKLQQDKLWSNRLVTRLGFPGVTHATAPRLADAIAMARQLGYPVVVKPIASGKGKGVSAYVMDANELAAAFEHAKAYSAKGVIVERHVAGHDHRLAVFGGRVAWVAARYPARVTGDGVHTIGELIQAENRRRTHDPATARNGLSPIVPDDALSAHLEKRGLSLTTRLPLGDVADLRSIANLSQGGSIEDVTSIVHPDNIVMAESIARGFRMDTVGVDFMTPDISRSWRDTPCAVIEVNGMPGIFHDERAERILLARFPAHSQGRIPVLLLLDAAPDLTARLMTLLQARGLSIGRVSVTSSELAGELRGRPDDDLPARVMAMIHDPDCEALVVETSHGWLDRNGLPLDKVGLVVAGSIESAEGPAWLRAASDEGVYARAEGIDWETCIDRLIGTPRNH